MGDGSSTATDISSYISAIPSMITWTAARCPTRSPATGTTVTPSSATAFVTCYPTVACVPAITRARFDTRIEYRDISRGNYHRRGVTSTTDIILDASSIGTIGMPVATSSTCRVATTTLAEITIDLSDVACFATIA